MDIPQSLIDTLCTSERVAVLTGAGISAESGIPTFREAQTGLWAQYNPEELATPGAFRRNPRLVWEWYQWRRGLVAKAQPNPGHLALAVMEAQVADFTLITQNVDGLHQRAGSRNVLELHGNLTRDKCFERGCVLEAGEQLAGSPPRCPHCGGYLRPDVVWFGESLPEEALHCALQASQNTQVFLSVGTSAIVHPAASLPEYALGVGAVVVEINPAETPLTQRATYVLQGPAGEVLPQLVRAVWPD